MKKALLIAMFLSAFMFTHSWGDVPRTISYQGVLTDNSGVPITGNKPITFRIFDPNGTNSWSEDHNVTFADNGVFSVILGSVNNDLDLPFDKPYSLEITVDGATLGPIPLTASPYSLNAPPAVNGGGDGTSQEIVGTEPHLIIKDIDSTGDGVVGG